MYIHIWHSWENSFYDERIEHKCFKHNSYNQLSVFISVLLSCNHDNLPQVMSKYLSMASLNPILITLEIRLYRNKPSQNIAMNVVLLKYFVNACNILHQTWKQMSQLKTVVKAIKKLWQLFSQMSLLNNNLFNALP